jgi:hypothetical protein
MASNAAQALLAATKSFHEEGHEEEVEKELPPFISSAELLEVGGLHPHIYIHMLYSNASNIQSG